MRDGFDKKSTLYILRRRRYRRRRGDDGARYYSESFDERDKEINYV